MELGMIGLGRMGSNMTQRLLGGGHRLVVYDPKDEAVQALVSQGALGTSSVNELIARLLSPRAVWIMVPAGKATESTVNILAKELSPGDIVIDGGNSNYKDSIRRAETLEQKGILFLDVGTSGGILGLKEGYSLMVGGEIGAFRHLETVFKTLAPSPDKGYGHVGPSGAGHFVKMIHNGIEYGLMEAYAEGFELLKAKKELDLKLEQVAEIWRFGSVVRSWLLDLIAAALKENPELKGIQAYVEDSGEGRWTAKESIDLAVPAPVIIQSLQARFRSRQEEVFSARLLAVMRHMFGGHTIKKSE